MVRGATRYAYACDYHVHTGNPLGTQLMAFLSQPYRLSDHALIDRSRPLSFSFDGISMEGFEGDTLASALLANGVRVVARSFKYHRPRGIYAGGLEEPNALVTIGEGSRSTPNTR